LDYLQEAGNLRRLGASLARFKDIIVPQPVDDYTTSRVLTMDYVLGTKVTAISPLTRMDIDAERLGRELVHAYLHQIDGLQKVANRVALGLIMAALIVAAALLMQVPATFRLLGYPGLAMILFIIAAGAGAMLAVQIVNHDRKARHH
jgi:hypothetical protein